jgi:hypothetical protein
VIRRRGGPWWGGPWWGGPVVAATAALLWQAGADRYFSVEKPWAGAVVTAALVLLGTLVVAAEGRSRPGRTGALDRMLLWAGFGVLVGVSAALAGTRWRDWDVLLLSGVLTLLLGVELADRVPRRLDRVITRLIDRKVVVITAAQRQDFDRRMAERCRRWTRTGGIVVTLTLLIAWVVVLADRSHRGQVLNAWFVVFEALLAWFAGRRIGRLSANSSFWTTLLATGAHVQVVPGHVDGAAGFRPLGGFYLFQSTIAGIPAAYLALWWWLIPLWPGYDYWRGAYLGMLPVAIGVEILAFVLPMIAVHTLMQNRKGELLAQADQISRTIDEIREKLTDSTSDPERQVAKNRITDLTEQYWTIERLPTWPVDAGLRRRFGLRNLPLFLPFVGYALDGTQLWQQVTDTLGGPNA